MDALILAGGKGTRLSSVISHVPKPMAPIADRPFMEYLLDYLIDQGVERLILSTGYKHEVIETFFGASYRGIEVSYVQELEPLGTGGAILRALETVTRGENVIVLNGDTYFPVDLRAMFQHHLHLNSDVTVALRTERNPARFGKVTMDGSRIVSFREKENGTGTLINGGIYIVHVARLLSSQLPNIFSFERDFLETSTESRYLAGFISDAYFIDIGIPEDYAAAQRTLVACHET